MRDSEENVDEASFEIDIGNENEIALFQVSHESQASQEYEDENAMPSDTEMLRAEQAHPRKRSHLSICFINLERVTQSKRYLCAHRLKTHL